MKDQILYLQNREIDKAIWDHCIETSPNGLIYATCAYLDHICENWDAVVINNYEAVMPIPWKKKFSIQYVYQPPFIQQLGLVYTDVRFKKFLRPVLQLINTKIKFGDYPLNFLNENVYLTAKQNYVLDLGRNYEAIAEQYSNDLKRNLKHAEKHHLRFTSSNNYAGAIKHYQLLYSPRMPHVTQRHFKNLMTLIHLLFEHNNVIVREAKDEKGNLLAINLCLKDSKRIYLLLSSTTNEGRKKEANHFLLDQMIKEFADQKLIFDFEGSDIPGIAYFYQGFGAENQPYFFYQWNQLPLPVKIFKNLLDKFKG